MFAGGERQELFTLNGSTLGEKLNKRATSINRLATGSFFLEIGRRRAFGGLRLRCAELFIAS